MLTGCLIFKSLLQWLGPILCWAHFFRCPSPTCHVWHPSATCHAWRAETWIITRMWCLRCLGKTLYKLLLLLFHYSVEIVWDTMKVQCPLSLNISWLAILYHARMPFFSFWPAILKILDEPCPCSGVIIPLKQFLEHTVDWLMLNLGTCCLIDEISSS